MFYWNLRWWDTVRLFPKITPKSTDILLLWGFFSQLGKEVFIFLGLSFFLYYYDTQLKSATIALHQLIFWNSAVSALLKEE